MPTYDVDAQDTETDPFEDQSAVTAAPTPTPEQVKSAIPTDVMPDFACSMQELKRRTDELKEFVRDYMQEGEDYGVIPGTNNKKVLFKPGAEKLNAIFGLAVVVEISNRVEDWDAGFAAYEVKVTLINKRTGVVEAEGIGSCNSRERKYKNQDSANVANTLLKMAKKRALVDATLSATRASGMFTQDLEDGNLETDASREQAAPQQVHASSNGNAMPSQSSPPQERDRSQPLSGSSSYINAMRAVEDGGTAICTACGGDMWDNRFDKKNPNGPDFKCKNNECKDERGYVTSIFKPRRPTSP